MTKLSPTPLDSKYLDRLVDTLAQAVSTPKDKKTTRQFLEAFLSHTELKMLAKRLATAKMLSEGLSYKEIKEKVGVQNATISRMSNILSTEDSDVLKRVVEKLDKLDPKKAKPTKRTPKKIQRKTPTPPPLKYAFGSSE